MKFPQVSGSNLLRERLSLPQDFKGQFNLLFVPFQQWQQMEVDSWLDFTSQMEQSFPGLAHYELPTIQKMASISQWFINEGMRAGIPNPKTRSQTITLYIDKNAFRQALDISDEQHITLVLTDVNGEIIWRERGAFSPEKGASLAHTLQARMMVINTTVQA